MGANAISIVIQENIDCAKRDVDWSDWRLAADIRNWEVDANGEYHFTQRLPSNLLEEGGFPVILCAKWVNDRLRSAGVEPKTQNVLGWKWKGKRIIPSQWAPSEIRGDYHGGNLVHHAHDYALTKWLPIEDEFKLSGKTESLAMVVPLLVAQRGHLANPEALVSMDWKTYVSTLRSKSGLAKYGKAMHKIMSRDLSNSPSEKFKMIDQAYDQLHTELSTCSLEELATIWFMELDNDSGNPNHAFRAVCWNGSPILLALGIKEETDCTFLTNEKTEVIVNKALASANPHQWLADAIYGSNKHELVVTDENGESIPGWDCKHCCDQLQTGLVVAIRKQKKRKEHRFVGNAIKHLNNKSSY